MLHHFASMAEPLGQMPSRQLQAGAAPLDAPLCRRCGKQTHIGMGRRARQSWPLASRRSDRPDKTILVHLPTTLIAARPGESAAPAVRFST